MAAEAEWFRAFVARRRKMRWRSGIILVELRLPADQVSVGWLRRASAHIESVTSDIGQMFAVVHGGESVLAERQAS